MTVSSRLERKTLLKDPAEWEKRGPRLDAAIKPVLEKQPGFQGVEVQWTDGVLVETTAWDSEENCRAYIRNGGAATVGTLADAAMPTAAYPDGTWTRTNSL